MIFIGSTVCLYFSIGYFGPDVNASKWKDLVSLAKEEQKYCFCTQKLHDGVCAENLPTHRVIYKEREEPNKKYEFLEKTFISKYCKVNVEKGLLLPETIICPDNESKIFVANETHTIQLICRIFDDNKLNDLLFATGLTIFGIGFMYVSIKFNLQY